MQDDGAPAGTTAASEVATPKAKSSFFSPSFSASHLLPSPVPSSPRRLQSGKELKDAAGAEKPGSLLHSLSSAALTAKRRASTFADSFRSAQGAKDDAKDDDAHELVDDDLRAPSSSDAQEIVAEKQRYPVFAKLNAAGLSALKAMGASRAAKGPEAISNPYNVVHMAHVVFDTKSLSYQGLPEEWANTDTSTYSQFGCSIINCPRVAVKGFRERIPAVLVQLRDELEKHNGLLVEGVFRVAASFGDQKAYKTQMDTGTFAGCKNNDDVMCMAALIKEWFRTMPVRLLNALPVELLRKGEVQMAVHLPEPNLSVFQWLLDLMAETVKQEEHNRMTVKAIAIVMAPNLYASAEGAQPMEVVTEMQGAVKVVEIALQEWLVANPTAR